MLVYLFGLAVCACVLFFASKIVHNQVVSISEIVGIPAFLISLLLVAFSTSIPELFVGITSALEGKPSFSLGDILGSNIINLTFIGGLTVILGRKAFSLKDYINRKELLVIFAVASVPVFLLIDGTISRLDGGLLLALYVLYVAYILLNRSKEDKRTTPRPGGLLKPITLFAIGIALLIGASEGIIQFAGSLSTDLHLTPFIIGVFAIAFSTSLPELIYGIRVGLEKRPELSVANLAGSSAVNASAILGIVALIHPITPTVLTSALITGFFGIIVSIAFFIIASKRMISPVHGAVLLVIYLGFVSFSFLL